MRPLQSLFFLLVLSSLLPGCGLLKRKKKEEPTGPKTTLIGIVEMVNPEQNYVLIRCEQVPALGAGAELVALDATGVESKLKLTPERKGRYLTADITNGSPKVANLVIYKTSGNAPLTPSSGPVPLPQAVPTTPMAPATPSLAPSSLSLDPLAPAAPTPVLVPVPTSELPPVVQ